MLTFGYNVYCWDKTNITVSILPIFKGGLISECFFILLNFLT